eukprot:gene2946-3213_t
MFARRVFSRLSTAQPIGQVRRMAGHHHAPVEYGKVEAVVRKYLPEDEHVVLGIFAFYGTLILIATSGSKKEKPVEAAAQSTTANTSGEIPSIESPEFDKWISVPGNVEKLFA